MSNRPKSQATRLQARTIDAAARDGSGKIIWLALGAIVAIAVVIGVLVTLGGDGTDADWAAETGFAEIVGEPLPLFGEGADPAVGLPAPVLRATDGRSGDVVDIGADDGNAKMIGFFAHWCPHCQREIPKIVAHLEESPLPDGVDLVAVSTGVDQGAPNYPPSAWFEREGYTGQVLLDTADRAAATGFGLSSYPYWVVVGGDGTVVARTTGELTTEQFEDLIATAEAAR